MKQRTLLIPRTPELGLFFLRKSLGPLGPRGSILLYRSKTYKPKWIHLLRSEALLNSNPVEIRANTPLGVLALIS